METSFPYSGIYFKQTNCNTIEPALGVNTFLYDKLVSTDDTVEDINKISKEKGFVEEGDMLINLAAMPVIDKGMVNTLRISQIN
jgi:pyruvate kinase